VALHYSLRNRYPYTMPNHASLRRTLCYTPSGRELSFLAVRRLGVWFVGVVADYNGCMTGTSFNLRSYIAPGAPATRKPCDGAERDLRIEFGFTPRWYRAALGIDFSQRWHTDPLYRHETVVQMRRELNRRFPRLNLGGDKPEEWRANLDGVHGGVLVAMLFGIPVEYYADNWPAARQVFLSEKAIERLEVPSLADTPVMAQILGQMEVIEREFGRVEGYLNWQGVLNNAYRLRGPEIFGDVLANPELAGHLFEVAVTCSPKSDPLCVRGSCTLA